MDTVVVLVRCQDLSLAVSGDAAWIERSPGSRGRTGIFKAEVASPTDHHWVILHTDAQMVSSTITNMYFEILTYVL